MSQGIYTATAGAIVRQQQLDQVSHNLANVDTAGFRAPTTSFEEVLVEMTGVHRQVRRAEMRVDTDPGLLERTGNALDVALTGAGFFWVRDGEGEALTRAGNFRLTGQGELVTAAGQPVLNVEGQPIFIPSESMSLSIDGQGRISDQLGLIDQLGVVTVGDPGNLQPRGRSLFAVGDQPLLGVMEVTMEQGYLEKSNVNAVEAMTDLIALQRSFEMMQQLLTNFRNMDNTSIRKVGQHGGG